MPRKPSIPPSRAGRPAPNDPVDKAGVLFSEAFSAFQAGQRDVAESKLREAVRINPNFAEAYNNLGNLLQESNRFEESETAFRRAIQLRPDYIDPHYNLGNLLKAAQRPAEAETTYRRALALKPDHAGTFLNLANLLQEEGRLDEAEADLRKAIEASPGFVHAKNNLANLLKVAGRLEEAEATFRDAIALEPGYADAQYNFGVLLREQGRTAEAEEAFRRTIELDPERADAHKSLAFLLKESKRLDEAEAAFLTLIDLVPNDIDARNALGVTLQEAKRPDEAEAVFRRLLEIQPDYADAYNNLGNIYLESRRLEDAETAYRKAAEVRPDHANAWNNLAILLMDMKRKDEAEAALRHAIEIQPDHVDAYNNLANVLQETGRNVEAEEAFRRAIELRPEFAAAHNNFANLLKATRRLTEAEEAYNRAIELQPDYADAYNNLGNLLGELNRPDEAEAAFRRSLELKPGNVETQWNLALMLLAFGRFQEGWLLHEARHHPDKKERQMDRPTLSGAQWQGESLAGKSLVIWTEQGFGDNIQFIRYAPLLKARGLDLLTLVYTPALLDLLATADGVDAVVNDSTAISRCDYWCFPLSLPLYFDTTLDTIPAKLPYLYALPERVERWQPRLAACPPGQLRVGLVWKGSATHKNDANRSLPGLATLAPLWTIPGVCFVSLQKGQGEDEAKSPPPSQPLLHLGSDIQDFADSAAVIAQLDLVICIDSAIAHLAGAMGKPVWVLLPAAGTDWRWLRERTDSPWYPDVLRLFRQPGDALTWDSTVEDMTQALRLWVTRQRSLPGTAKPPVRPLQEGVYVVHPPPPSSDLERATVLFNEASGAFQAGRRDLAESNLREAVSINPNFAEAYNNLGNLLQESNRFEEAETCFRRATQLRPDYIDPHYNLGNLLKAAERPAEAEAAYRHVLTLKADHAGTFLNLANLLQDNNRLDDAETTLRLAIEQAPDYTDALNNLGNLLKQREQFDQAEAAYRRAIEVDPDNLNSHNNLGILLLDDLRLDAAESIFRRAIEIQPEHADAYNNLGLVFMEARRMTEAEASFKSAIERNPDHVDAHNNIGIVFMEARRFEEADTAFRKVIQVNPEHVGAHVNIGNLRQRLEQLDQAESEYRAALALDPNHTEARINLAYMLLSLGRLKEAWPHHEVRHRPDKKERRMMQPNLPFPQWQGESLDGKSLVIWTEQGFGDNIQFIRYAPLLKARGLRRLTVMQHPAMITLFASQEGVDASIANRAELQPHDYWCFPLSLPLYFDTTLDTIPAKLPYLYALPERAERWQPRLAACPPGQLRVGLVWKGSAAHKNDVNRSLPGLVTLAPLWTIPGVCFVSLQKAQGEDEAKSPPPDQPLIHLGSDIQDFADSAAIVAQLDLIICIDSAIAHLAGALGKPVWVLLPDIGTDWRWLRERTDSPWYPDILRLFRQPRDAVSWDSTVDAVADALTLWASAQNKSPRATATPPVRALPDSVVVGSMPPPTIAATPVPDPEQAGRLFDQAISALHEGRRAEAESRLRSAIALKPDFPAAHNNLGNLLLDDGRLAEAETAYRRAVAPEYLAPHWNLAILLLSMGRLSEAWPHFLRHYESYRPEHQARFGIVPEWRGESLQDKTLAIETKEGFGDNVQFARYAPLLRQRGLARLVLRHPKTLKPLLETIDGVDAVVADYGDLPPLDYWCYSLSLPLHFSTGLDSIPAQIPYVFPLEARLNYWRKRLAPLDGLRVGLVWKGSVTHDNDHNRSLPGLQTLAPLWSLPGITFLSLQKGQAEDEATNPPPAQPISHLGSDIQDFGDTAAVVSLLDLVICVDTSIAHVAGALGKPVWVLLPAIGTDWRWLRKRTDSPWYPGVMRLFRQTTPGDWSPVITQIVAALARWGQSDPAIDSVASSTDMEADQPMIRPEDAALQQHFLQQNVPGVTSISMQRRVHDARFATRYFCGDGIDVGGGNDSLALFKEFFPLVRNLFVYDQAHGDGQVLANVADASFDFLYSSHCLEHLRDPYEALRNWLRVIKPGGHLVIQVPDEDLYEQGVWPSRFNSDHKLSFTICKNRSWSPVSINVLDLLHSVCGTAAPLSIELIDRGYRYGLKNNEFDQTRTPLAEAGIEFVLRKWPA
jgi:tetratricopeptide (TPR) repeat protein/SAM-dependent methyltransferase